MPNLTQLLLQSASPAGLPPQAMPRFIPLNSLLGSAPPQEPTLRAYDIRRGDYALDQPTPDPSPIGQLLQLLLNPPFARPGISAGVMPMMPSKPSGLARLTQPQQDVLPNDPKSIVQRMGGEWAGADKGAVYFAEPETGTPITLPLGSVTQEAVLAEMTKARKAAGLSPAVEPPLEFDFGPSSTGNPNSLLP